jgi:hypothetical protein
VFLRSRATTQRLAFWLKLEIPETQRSIMQVCLALQTDSYSLLLTSPTIYSDWNLESCLNKLDHFFLLYLNLFQEYITVSSSGIHIIHWNSLPDSSFVHLIVELIQFSLLLCDNFQPLSLSG